MSAGACSLALVAPALTRWVSSGVPSAPVCFPSPGHCFLHATVPSYVFAPAFELLVRAVWGVCGQHPSSVMPPRCLCTPPAYLTPVSDMLLPGRKSLHYSRMSNSTVQVVDNLMINIYFITFID